MHGQTRDETRRYYRCAARARHPGIADAHTRDLFVPEQPINTALDEWLGELLAPDQAAETAEEAEEIVSALATGPDRSQQIEAARRRITGSRQEVEPRRAALREAGSQAARREVLAWLDEAAAEKEHAEAALRTAMELAPPVLSVDEVLAVVGHFGGSPACSTEPPRPNAPRCTPRWESAPSITQSATRSDSGSIPLLQRCVGGGT